MAKNGGTAEQGTIQELVRRCLSPSSDLLLGALRDAQQMLVSVLEARAAEPLIAVRATTSKYRMTNAPPPSTPQLYVRGVTQPLRAALAEGAPGGDGGGCLAILSADLRANVLAEILTGVAGKYNELVSEVLVNVKKLGQTLKKLQKGSSSSGAGMSDDEKIYLQMYLDVEALSHELEELGGDVGNNDAFKALRDKITAVCQEHAVTLP
eukprot:Tamp_21868.p1 GENE.Tamp_21868~~Tamp_21868.p1  ORF type:complete len:209 (-),score=37.56 Tamp_21868:493-1119(-)